MEDAVLRFERVSRNFTGFAAVESVDLTLRRGEILTLLGPSGCGKTTTLRMAIGLERCTTGRILHRDRIVDAPGERLFVPPEARNMGIVFQSYAVWPHMTVFENVAFPLQVRKLPKREIQQKVAAALTMVGLSDFSDRLGTKLSGGQQQRVAIARGLVFNPDVLLLDEPFSNLDAHLREQMRVELKQLQRNLNISVLFVTHDQSEALALSDRVAIMRAGRIEQLGPPAELYSNPATPFVRDFLGHWVRISASVAETSGDRTRLKLKNGDALLSAAGGHIQGSDVLATIRPEHIEFISGQNTKPDNAIGGTIRTLLFLGPVFEGSIVLASGETILVNLPNNQQWAEGQEIWLRFSPDAVRLWPAAG